MLKFVDTKVTFQEVPNEISLCINLSGCPHRCEGCHSPYLQKDAGTVLTKTELDSLIKANEGITCVCFMGGDNDIPALTTLAWYVQTEYNLKTAWYTGLTWSPKSIERPTTHVFDFIKTGPYIKEFGPITNPNTNQRFYTKGTQMKKMDANPHMFYDTTDKFWKNES